MEISHFGEDWNVFQLIVEGPKGWDLRTVFGDIDQKRVVLADEIYWNEHSAVGDNLSKMVEAAEKAGFETGVTISPVVFFNIDWTVGKASLKSAEEIAIIVKQLESEIQKVDFVAVDPYKGIIPGADDAMLKFSHLADDWIHGLGKKAIMVVQGFARKGEEDATLDFINDQLVGQSYDEVVVFGLEDAPDLSPIDFVGINNQVLDILGGV